MSVEAPVGAETFLAVAVPVLEVPKPITLTVVPLPCGIYQKILDCIKEGWKVYAIVVSGIT